MSNVLVIPFTLALYIGLAVFVRGYSAGWVLPETLSDRTLLLRSRVGFAIGGVGAFAAALVCALTPFEQPALRWIIAFQAALMAAAGASDLRRFLLPLPITAFGLVLAVATLIATEPSLIVIGIALGWALLCIGINAIASKGTVQLGDHLAVLWIALAAPFNGMLAFTLGTFANAITVIAFRWTHRHVAVAGAWLIFAALLVGLPPFYAWTQPVSSTRTVVTVIRSSAEALSRYLKTS